MPIYIKKYTGDNYFNSRTFVDSIVINGVPNDSLPRFGYEVENNASVGQYRAGDFDLTLSFLQTETSGNGLTIREFLLGADRDFYLLVIMTIGSQSFCGTVQAGKISADYDDETITLIVKDILIEWANRCSISPNSTIVWNGTLATFENYILMHFTGLTGGVVSIDLPSSTYLSRLQIYGSPGECFAFKDFYDFITGQVNISRWETFKELALGMGFNFEMFLSSGTEIASEPEFIFKIFFIADVEAETPIDLDVQAQKEYTTEKRLEWLYFNYRYFTISNVDYTNGILINAEEEYYTDTDHSNGATLYPCITRTLEGRVITVTNDTGGSVVSVVTETDCKEFELTSYYYSLASGGGIGKLFPLTEEGVTGGGMAYCHIFHTTINPSIYDFNPIQRYAVTNYRRYLRGLQKAKNLIVTFNKDTLLKLWKPVNFNDGNGNDVYYISAIRNIDLDKETAEIELINFA